MKENQKPVVFLAFANDQDDRVGYLRNLPEEARRIREPMQRARADGLCDLVEIPNATADDIFKVFQSPEYRDRIAVFHYAGHANGYELLLESSDRVTMPACARSFADFLGQQTGLQLVFLNGCSTQNHVQGLLQANVAAVVATSRSIDDAVAMDFSSRFYRGLAGGAGIQRAFNEASAAAAMQTQGRTRGAYFGEEKVQANADRWPWDIYVRDGAESVTDWSLPGAAGDPLFGLPQLPKQDLPASPYRHLNWYREEDAELFFGRGHQIRELYDLVTTDDSAPIIMLYGRSGVGKSSVLSAGLIPRLRETHEIVYVRRNQAVGLAWSMKDAIGAERKSKSGSTSVHCAADWDKIEQRSQRPLLVIVDQVEECFTRPNAELPSEMNDFLSEVHHVFGDRESRPRGKLILGFRKEWLADIEGQVEEYRLPKSKVFLERLGRRGIIEAILGPAVSPRLKSHYRLDIKDHLAELIADNLAGDRESAIAPTLQILLTKMWDKANEISDTSPVFDQALYHSLKEQGILLHDFLDQQLSKLGDWHSDVAESGLALDLLAHHTTELGTANARFADELPKLYEHREDVIHDLIQRCKDLYLLVDLHLENRTSAAGTRLSHDTLAPLVRARFERSEKPGQRAQRVLKNRISDWSMENPGAPLGPRDLQIVEQGLQGSRALTDLEKKLLDVSRKERDNQERLKKYIKISGIVAGLLILVSLTLVGILMLKSKDLELDKRALAIANQEQELELAETKAAALAESARQKQEWLRQSLSVVDRFYTEIAQNDLINQPGMTGLRTTLLEKGTDFLQSLATDYGDGSELKAEIAKAQYHLGQIRLLDKSTLPDAQDCFNQALTLQTDLLQQSPEDISLQVDLSRTLMEIGNVHNLQDRKSEALACFDQARQIRAGILRTSPALAEIRILLADAEMSIGLVFEKLHLVEPVVPFLTAGRVAETFFLSAQNHRTRVYQQWDNQIADLDDPHSSESVAASLARLRAKRKRAFGYTNLQHFYKSMALALWDQYDATPAGPDQNALADQAVHHQDLVCENCSLAIEGFQEILLDQPHDGRVRHGLIETLMNLAMEDETRQRELLESAVAEAKILAMLYPKVEEFQTLRENTEEELRVLGTQGADPENQSPR